jgi:hypothetical protein
MIDHYQIIRQINYDPLYSILCTHFLSIDPGLPPREWIYPYNYSFLDFSVCSFCKLIDTFVYLVGRPYIRWRFAELWKLKLSKIKFEFFYVFFFSCENAFGAV